MLNQRNTKFPHGGGGAFKLSLASVYSLLKRENGAKQTKPVVLNHVSGPLKAFILAEVLMAKRMSDKTCSQEFVRMSEPKAPTKIINKLCAFTLAEVLITLAIIGVVAALTIPTVVRNYQEKQTVVRVKKAYTTFNQALLQAQAVNGAMPTWNWRSARDVYNIFSPYLKISKFCEYGTGCFSPNVPKELSGKNRWGFNNKGSMDTNTTFLKATLVDGTSFWLYSWYKNGCTSNGCGVIGIDIDGAKGPNTFGRDIFYFMIGRNNLLPWGYNNFGGDESWRNLSNYCNATKTYTSMNGVSCSAWILQKGNMDYLHKEVSW